MQTRCMFKVKNTFNVVRENFKDYKSRFLLTGQNVCPLKGAVPNASLHYNNFQASNQLQILTMTVLSVSPVEAIAS